MVWKICTKQLILKDHKILTKRVKTQREGQKLNKRELTKREVTKENSKRAQRALISTCLQKHRQETQAA